MPRIGPAEDWSIRINGKVTEAMQRKALSKSELCEKLGLGKETLSRKGREKTLGTLDFLTIALIAEAAGYEIDFVRRTS
ncbi:transcriptional regulator with XRE-family HTH domain [Moryella indoligenes]|uniref:Transcriptional regulator with XRE-family HTH domain n=1 Tax=Moryella indoligenes TaxID=371674 RepID=A0AAE3VBA3_9FIRM|nr:hypothetical protein [Moryella indoligenes]MDQ0153152.1 transcriptional regulator with XRE-family HTH domain [Moryella indoligenes]